MAPQPLHQRWPLNGVRPNLPSLIVLIEKKDWLGIFRRPESNREFMGKSQILRATMYNGHEPTTYYDKLAKIAQRLERHQPGNSIPKRLKTTPS